MSGILFWAVVALWLYVAHRITLLAIRRVEGDKRFWAYAGVVAVVLSLPVADEIVADIQLESVCREGAVMKIDEAKIKGRRVRYSSEPLDERVPGIVVPVTFTLGVLRDAETNELLGSRGSFRVKGGLLVRVSGISESDTPLFARAFCAPERGEHTESKRIGFTIVN